MLSGLFTSEISINKNIATIQAFVEMRKIFLQNSDLKMQLSKIKQRMGEHSVQLNQICDAMGNLLDKKPLNGNG